MKGFEQTRAVPKEIEPLRGKINWWALLGLLSMVSSAFLSVSIFWEILEFLESVGVLESLPFFG